MKDESGTTGARRKRRLLPRSSFLVPYLLLLCLLAGCRRPAVLPPAPRYVRWEALLPLHPAWTQTQSLERIAGSLAPVNEAIKGGSSALPSPFPFVQTTPKNLAEERRRRIKDDADKYLEQLALFLIADNAQRLDRETRARKRQADAQYRRELEGREAQLKAEAAKRTSALNAKINRLGYTAIDYESQVRVYTNAMKIVAQANLRAVNQQIDALTTERDAIPTDFRPAALTQLQARREELTHAVDTFQKRRAAELAAELQDQLANRSSQLEAAAGAITTLGQSLPATPKPAAVPVPPPPDFGAARSAAQAQITAALARQKTATAAQRDRLIAVIQADTDQAVQQIAIREGWRLVPAGTKFASDATDDAAKALRAQWKKSPSQ